MPFDPPMAQKKNTPKATDSRPTLGRRKVHRIVFVTGKGGVGKSAVAAATALQFARAGKTVLLVELGSRSFYGPLLGLPVGADTVRMDVAASALPAGMSNRPCASTWPTTWCSRPRPTGFSTTP